jgi:hypothetical protein
MSHSGPMGPCGVCYNDGKLHKFFCKKCGEERPINTDGFNETWPWHCGEQCRQECPPLCGHCLRPLMTPGAPSIEGRCLRRWYSEADLQHGDAIGSCLSHYVARLQLRVKALETERATLVLELQRHRVPGWIKFQ